MKILNLALLFSTLSLGTISYAREGFPWQAGQIRKVDVVREPSVVYTVTYDARCNEIVARGFRFTTDKDTVVGVASQIDITVPCDSTPNYKEIIITGEKSDPENVQSLEPF